MSTISSSTTSTTAYKVTADTTGTLVIQTGATPTTAVTVGTDQSVTLAGNLTVTGTTTTTGYINVPNTFGFKNRIINGAMVIDQRNNGASVTPTTNGGYSVDRWQMGLSVASKFSIQQSSTAPTGFAKSILITSLSAYSPTSTDLIGILQPIEGLNMTDVGFGAAGASTLTLSFWVRSSLTGTFGGVLTNYANDRSYPFSYTINSANTFEQKTITITGDTTGTWNTTNNGWGQLWFALGVGSTKATTAGSWVAGAYYSVTGATNLVATNGATLYITGVQLEKGSTATSFDYRPYGTELALCQRYYWRIDGFNGLTAIGAGSVYNVTTTSRIYIKFPMSMRTAPTISIAGTLISSGGSADNTVSSVGATNIGIDTALIDFTTSAGTIGQGKTIYVNSNASYNVNYLQAAAEL